MSARPLLLGHRGARGVHSIPENTFPSFDRALADGCDGFEFDVRLTADQQAVIFHDPKFGRLEIAKTPATNLDGLPDFSSVLERYCRRAFLDIELKVPGLEKLTLELLWKHPPSAGYVVSSFLPEVLRTLRKEDEGILLGLICETRRQLEKWHELPVEYVIPHSRLITKASVEKLSAAGKKVVAWTVNDEDEMMRFADMGVAGIISDETALLVRTLRKTG